MVSKKNNIELFNNVLLWVASLLLFSGAIINQQIIHYDHIFLQFIITVTLAFVACFIVFKKTFYGAKFVKIWIEAIAELKRVTWPTKQETVKTTIAVVVMVIIMGIILWTVDAVLIRLVAWLLERGV